MPIHNNQETKKRNEERSEICIFPLKKEEQQEENLKRKEYKLLYLFDLIDKKKLPRLALDLHWLRFMFFSKFKIKIPPLVCVFVQNI